jgi:hypothetical protein
MRRKTTPRSQPVIRPMGPCIMVPRSQTTNASFIRFCPQCLDRWRWTPAARHSHRVRAQRKSDAAAVLFFFLPWRGQSTPSMCFILGGAGTRGCAWPSLLRDRGVGWWPEKRKSRSRQTPMYQEKGQSTPTRSMCWHLVPPNSLWTSSSSYRPPHNTRGPLTQRGCPQPRLGRRLRHSGVV